MDDLDVENIVHIVHQNTSGFGPARCGAWYGAHISYSNEYVVTCLRCLALGSKRPDDGNITI